MAIKALNLGSGGDYRESTDEIKWTNADNGKCKVDVVLDINNVPYDEFTHPIGLPDYFDRIDAIQVLEHLDKSRFPAIIRELYRISSDGAVWNIAVPHAFSDNFATDPTHSMPFTTRTMDYFCENLPPDRIGLRENGIIYGWGDIHLCHIQEPWLDGVQSIHFTLRVLKSETPKE